MITDGQLRIISRIFLSLITRNNKLNIDDIRYLKSGQGVFPTKTQRYDSSSSIIKPIIDYDKDFVEEYTSLVEKTVQIKEIPYTAEDLFIIFQIQTKSNESVEYRDDTIASLLPFDIIVNIYGNESPDELQYMLMRIHSDDVRSWLTDRNISIMSDPTDIVELDQIENQSWWIRRRFVLPMNIQQTLLVKDDSSFEIKDIKFTLEELGGEL